MVCAGMAWRMIGHLADSGVVMVVFAGLLLLILCHLVDHCELKLGCCLDWVRKIRVCWVLIVLDRSRLRR